MDLWAFCWNPVCPTPFGNHQFRCAQSDEKRFGPLHRLAAGVGLNNPIVSCPSTRPRHVVRRQLNSQELDAIRALAQCNAGTCNSHVYS